MKLVVALAIAAAVAAKTPGVAGDFVAFGVDERGGFVRVHAGGAVRTLRLASAVQVRERVRDSSWQTIEITALKPHEPVAARLDERGRVVRLDAEYDRVVARIVTVADGYAVTTSGATYRLAGAAVLAAGGLPLGTYALLKINASDGSVFDLVTSRSRLTPTGERARVVTVTFIVRVPVNTPPSDTVYLTTNAQNWTPNAIRMSPLAGNRWTATLQLTGGTLLAYKYTRGSWTTDERNPAGVEISNRKLSVTTTQSAQTQDDAVARWADLAS